jgi:hypothetical protein
MNFLNMPQELSPLLAEVRTWMGSRKAKAFVRPMIILSLGGHPNSAIDGHLKTDQQRKHSGH